MESLTSNGVSQDRKNGATNGHSIRHDTANPERLFDSLNQTYSDVYEKNAVQVQSIERLLSMLSPGSQVLDIGSGTGLPAASMMVKAGMDVTGIDNSAAMINAARVNVPSAHFHKCNMRHYRPPNDKKYDAIVANLSILMVSTSTIREMAFKIAHWLKPGGLVMIGIIDWTDITQAEGWVADPYNEWLNHHFMGQVIKDNLFDVGQWISLLRSADIALVDIQGTVFEAEDSGIVTEPECFFLGRKGDQEALMGPFRTPTNIITGLSTEMLIHVEQHLVADREEFGRLLEGLPNVVDVCKTDGIGGEESAIHEVKNADAHGKTATNGVIPSIDIQQLCSSHNLHNNLSSGIVLVQPSPFNDFVTILNNAASFFNLPIIHTGARLRATVTQLRSKGFTNLQISALGDEYLDFSNSKTIVDDAARLAIQAFTVHRNRPLWEGIQSALKAQLEKYFANQTNFGSYANRIGFQRIVLIARQS